VNLSEPFVKRPIATVLLTIGIALAGIGAFFVLPVSPLPQVDYPTISVSASLPGASPETMATSVATPLEVQFSAIPGMTQMTSSSALGSSLLTLQFTLNKSIDTAAQEVQAAINTAAGKLPKDMPTLPTLAKHSFVVFAPGAEYGPAKRWPAKHFAELASKIDRPVFLLGSNKEFDICQEIATTANATKPGHCFNLAGQTNLMQAFALIAYAHRVVSNDSGLMHVAAAFGVPQVAVFGSSSPEHTPPLNDRARVVWLRVDKNYQPPLACAPCYERTCPLGHMRCLEDVSAERVYRLL